MIVYVESNFVLELTFEQEQAASAATILALTETKQIKLVYPTFILSEPFESVMRERRERDEMYNKLVPMLKKLQRSTPFREDIGNLITATAILKGVYIRQLDLLLSTFDKLLNVGESIEVNVANLREAIKYQGTFDLSPQDSIIYAAIIGDLKSRLKEEQKCFLSRDEKAFDNPTIKQELGGYNCRYIKNFNDGLQFIQHAIQKAE